MKTIIERVFSKKDEAEAAPQHTNVTSELTTRDIEAYYVSVIADVLRRMLVPAESIEVGVKRSGTGQGGLLAFAGYVRILRWDAVMMPVLLQNLPVIDARIRKVVAASVILEHTHFAGLWVQATSKAVGAPQQLMGMPAELVVQPTPPNP